MHVCTRTHTLWLYANESDTVEEKMMMQESEMQEQPSGRVRGDGIQHRNEKPAMDSSSTVAGEKTELGRCTAI